MAFNDFLKKAKDAAASAADSAKTAAGNAKAVLDEKKQAADAKKAEQERIAAEQQAAADARAAALLEQMAGQGGLLDIDGQTLLSFTADYYDRLYLPAHSVSASKWVLHPLDKKLEKYAKKDFPECALDAETPVFLLIGKAGARILLTTRHLWFKSPFEDTACYVAGKLPIAQVGTMAYTCDDQGNYIFTCNGVELINTHHGFEMDPQSFAAYADRLARKDFVITDEQVDALIQQKIGDKILKNVREYAFEDELLLYFAWGCDSITAKDFVVCTNKQLVVLDREAFGLTKNVKQFYYEDVTSMSTLQETSGLLDLALTAALSLCTLQITVAGNFANLQNLYTYEAEKAVKVYRECRRSQKEADKQPQVVIQQAAAEDPLAQLEKLNKLKEMGVISDEEFAAKKADLLAKL
ncbi:MAG: SHOCT domain-containing protein [Clostridia bacterium]|nr:SHOCT domain-containing protein [Clostridia bacterium]